MSNPDFGEDPNKRKSSAPIQKNPKPGPMGTVNEKTANWGGVPGKSQSKSRNAGVKQLKTYPTSTGL